MIDTEKDSGKLYSDLTQFDHCGLSEPYTPERFIALINGAESAGYDCLVIDSMSHEWNGAGGVLEIHDTMPGNSWTNWSKVNPRHDAFINAMLNAKCHIIATIRSKQAYTQEVGSNGKQQVKKLGMAPQQRDGVEYEFTAVLKMDISHNAEGDKDRTGLFPVGEWILPTIETGKNLAAWLGAGVEPVVDVKKAIKEDIAPTINNDSRTKVETALAWIDNHIKSSTSAGLQAGWDQHFIPRLKEFTAEHQNELTIAYKDTMKLLVEQERKA